jgi:hypothetical protein
MKHGHERDGCRQIELDVIAQSNEHRCLSWGVCPNGMPAWDLVCSEDGDIKMR